MSGGGTVVAVGDLPTKEAEGNDADLQDALRALFAEGRHAQRAADAATAVAAVAASGTAAAVVAPHTSDVHEMRLGLDLRAPDTCP